MSDENIDNRIVEHILTLKDQVLKWAAPKQHLSRNPNDHGKATDNEYGHVIVNNSIENNDNPASSSAIITYISTIKETLEQQYNIITSNETFVDADSDNNAKKNLPTTKAVLKKIDEALSSFQPFNILTEIKSNTEHEDDNNKKNIPTAKAVWDALESYRTMLKGVSYKMPESYSGSINNLITAGYYIMEHDEARPKSFSYGGETIYYTNALVTVKKQSNRVIQHVCATTKVTSSTNPAKYKYKINGSEYTRYGSYNSNGETTWKPWHLAHKPYSKTSRVKKLGKGVDDNSVVVYENTAGFIIQWKQTNSNQKRYPIDVDTPLYQYVDVCEFSPALPITGPYVFGNLIGRMDIKITPTKMQIRSNVAPGGRIIEMEETYFIPRNQ